MAKKNKKVRLVNVKRDRHGRFIAPRPAKRFSSVDWYFVAAVLVVIVLAAIAGL